jgi:hypothetical protein
MDEAVDSLVGVPATLALGPKMWSWGKGKMNPRIIFGAPQHPLDVRYDESASWWFASVLVRPASWWPWRNAIERATVRLIPETGGSGISLRWWSRDSKIGTSERTIEAGRVYLIPVVRRDERNGNYAVITNENWMLDKIDREKHKLEPGDHKYWLETWSGDRHWKSQYKYRIHVPPSNSGNGQFTMSVFYGAVY